MAKIIDLSKTIKYNKNEPFWMRVKVKHTGHKFGRFVIRIMFGLPIRLFPKNFIGWADDTIKKFGVHSSTHLDAPWHYHPTSEGRPSKTIDQIPLEWCYGPGVVIDVTKKPDYDIITVEDLKADLKKTKAKIKPGTIVLIRTGRDVLMGTPDYLNRGTGMSREATEWLLNLGVKIIGIDQWGFDLPLKWTVNEAKRLGKQDIFWQSHLVGMNKEYCHIEQLVNLGALPSHGFKVAVFPLKIEGASAAPARVVAIFEEK